MPTSIDLTGQRFGRLVVIKFAGRSAGRARVYQWVCECDCGTQTVVSRGSLRSGNTVSCGCYHKECVGAAFTKHGRTREGADKGVRALYNVWKTMRQRCYCESCNGYSNYGGRGIIMCERWLESFENFYADMGDKPTPQHSLERIDNNGPYSPENCKWGTRTEQNNNTRVNRWITINEETMTMSQWAARAGIKPQLVWVRLSNGWSTKDAVFTPVGSKRTKVRV